MALFRTKLQTIVLHQTVSLFHRLFFTLKFFIPAEEFWSRVVVQRKVYEGGRNPRYTEIIKGVFLFCFVLFIFLLLLLFWSQTYVFMFNFSF